jgi:DNA-binding NarL/FixJ family response regulator
MIENEKSLTSLMHRAEQAFASSRAAARESIRLQAESEHWLSRMRSGPNQDARHRHAAAKPGDSTLSPRERTVLSLIVQGCSTREIAAKLGISFKTASTHRASIMGKLMVHKSAALVREAYRRGFVE